jgi:hypothetical protein
MRGLAYYWIILGFRALKIYKEEDESYKLEQESIIVFNNFTLASMIM